MARKVTVLPAVISNRKSIQILEALSKSAHKSPPYRRLRLCSLDAICPVSGHCVSASPKGSETNKERTGQTWIYAAISINKLLAAP